MASRYQVEVTPVAQKELYQIILYLSEEASWQTAKRVRNGLEEEIAELSNRPESNGLLQGVTGKRFTYRRVIKWSYRIIYTIVEDRSLVAVVRIDHVKRHPDRLKDLP